MKTGMKTGYENGMKTGENPALIGCPKVGMRQGMKTGMKTGRENRYENRMKTGRYRGTPKRNLPIYIYISADPLGVNQACGNVSWSMPPPGSSPGAPGTAITGGGRSTLAIKRAFLS